MDEPLSNLDAKLRLAMRSELIQLHEQLKTTFIYVTHDQMESMAMADQIVLMDQGTIMQQAAPEVIYHDPDNIFTAQFIGMPPANILELPGQAGSIGFRPERVKLNAGREKQASAAAERSLPGSCWGQKSSIKSRSQREWLWSAARSFPSGPEIWQRFSRIGRICTFSTVRGSGSGRTWPGCWNWRREERYEPYEKEERNENAEKKRGVSRFTPYALIGPAMALMAVFVFYPLADLVYLSFFDYNLIGKKKFAGLGNYKVLFFVKTDFWEALSNTAVYTGTVVVLSLLLAVLFAMWLERDSLVNRFLQKSMFTPYLISMVSCAYIWSWMYNDDSGILNAMLAMFGLPLSRWLNDSHIALFCVAAVAVWKSLGYYLIIVLASVRTIPPEILEAAELDNTSPVRKFFRITLPMISPQLFFLLITITISSFKVFDTIQVMTGGGPGNATDVLVTYIYRYAFEMNARVGYASAAGTVLLVILMILTFVYFRMLGRKVYYQ